MYKYDIRYANPTQLTLMYLGSPLNVSKKKPYLIEKMKAHRDTMCSNPETSYPATYEIIDSEGTVIFSYTFEQNEKGYAKEPYNKIKKDTTNYVKRDDFMLIADEEGNVLTNEALLAHLVHFEKTHIIPVMITKKALVSMATYKPSTKNEFVSLDGLGEKVYAKCGEVFLKVIHDFLTENKQ